MREIHFTVGPTVGRRFFFSRPRDAVQVQKQTKQEITAPTKKATQRPNKQQKLGRAASYSQGTKLNIPSSASVES